MEAFDESDSEQEYIPSLRENKSKLDDLMTKIEQARDKATKETNPDKKARLFEEYTELAEKHSGEVDKLMMVLEVQEAEHAEAQSELQKICEHKWVTIGMNWRRIREAKCSRCELVVPEQDVCTHVWGQEEYTDDHKVYIKCLKCEKEECKQESQEEIDQHLAELAQRRFEFIDKKIDPMKVFPVELNMIPACKHDWKITGIQNKCVFKTCTKCSKEKIEAGRDSVEEAKATLREQEIKKRMRRIEDKQVVKHKGKVDDKDFATLKTNLESAMDNKNITDVVSPDDEGFDEDEI